CWLVRERDEPAPGGTTGIHDHAPPRQILADLPDRRTDLDRRHIRRRIRLILRDGRGCVRRELDGAGTATTRDGDPGTAIHVVREDLPGHPVRRRLTDFDRRRRSCMGTDREDTDRRHGKQHREPAESPLSFFHYPSLRVLTRHPAGVPAPPPRGPPGTTGTLPRPPVQGPAPPCRASQSERTPLPSRTLEIVRPRWVNLYPPLRGIPKEGPAWFRPLDRG